MKTDQLFLASDAALRSVIDRISPDDLSLAAPEQWLQAPGKTMHDILAAHAYDEAWVPGVISGDSVVDGDELRDRDLLGDDPIAAYDALNDAATARVRVGVAPGTVFRFQYGDFLAEDGLVHLACYRAFQAWQIAKHLGLSFQLSPEIIAGMNEHVVPHVEEWRGFGVFPPPIDPPVDADDETRLLCVLGFWVS